MREHFEFQRKTYYLAETVHQGTRDTVQPDEDELPAARERGAEHVRRRFVLQPLRQRAVGHPP